jgi:hypothetical protein
MRVRSMFLAAAFLIATAFSAHAAPTEPADTPWAVNFTDSPAVLVPVAAPSALELIDPADALALMPDDGSWSGCTSCKDCSSCPPPVLASTVGASHTSTRVAVAARRERMRA